MIRIYIYIYDLKNIQIYEKTNIIRAKRFH